MNNEYFYKMLLDHIDDGIYFVDSQRKISFWNKGAKRITGFSASEVLESFCFNNILNHINEDGVELCKNGCPLHKTLADGKTRDAAVYLHHKQGHRVPVTIHVVPIKEGEKIIGAVEIFNDNLKKHEIIKNMERLKHLAMYDQLTALPNRRYIDTFLASKMNEYLSLGIPFGVAMIDIDKFKNFNDTYGHDAGDEVLKMISNVFKELVRSSDLIGRWGGEEFIGVFVGIDDNNLYDIVEKIRMLVEMSSLRNYNETLKVTISIGATLAQKEDTIEQLVKRADELLYKSKSSGRNCITMG